jgi:hypothetical protein
VLFPATSFFLVLCWLAYQTGRRWPLGFGLLLLGVTAFTAASCLDLATKRRLIRLTLHEQPPAHRGAGRGGLIVSIGIVAIAIVIVGIVLLFYARP